LGLEREAEGEAAARGRFAPGRRHARELAAGESGPRAPGPWAGDRRPGAAAREALRAGRRRQARELAAGESGDKGLGLER